MGSHYVNAVIHGLKGCEISHSWNAPNGKIQKRSFGASDLALLAVIANEQPNPGRSGVTDTICYRDIQTLSELSHISRSSLLNVRNFLVSVGLLNFHRSEAHLSVTGDGTTKTYENVYRIVVPKIREYCVKIDDATWCNKVLRLGANDLKSMSREQRKLLGLSTGGISTVQNSGVTVQNSGASVQNTDTAVQNTDTTVQNTDTTVQNLASQSPESGHKHIDKQKENTNINTNETLLNEVRVKIALVCNVLPNKILPSKLTSVIDGYTSDKVWQAFEYASQTLASKKERVTSPVGFFIGCLQNALKSDIKLTPEDQAQAFGAPKRTLTHKESAKIEWDDICKKYHFDQLPEEDFNKLTEDACKKLEKLANTSHFKDHVYVVQADTEYDCEKRGVVMDDAQKVKKIFMKNLDEHMKCF